MTISSGTATLVPTRDESPFDLVHQADTALYASKERGRDRNTHFAADLAAVAS